MRILIVEDDYYQANLLQTWLTQQRLFQAEVTLIRTESEFRQALNGQLSKHPPDIVLMDVMLRWADPSPTMPEPPEEVLQDGFYRAGIRCERLFRANPATSQIPVILYTLLEHTDLAEELEGDERNQLLFYSRKEPDPQSLINKISELTSITD